MIEFVTDAHKERFMQAWSLLGYEQLPADWAACLFILTADVYLWKQIAKCIDFGGRLISWTKIRKIVTGHGWRCMLQLANQLYNGDGKLNMNELILCVDQTNFGIALRAIRVLYHGSQALQLTA